MHEKIGSWSLVVSKSRDQENYPSRLLVTSVKTPLVSVTLITGKFHLIMNFVHRAPLVVVYTRSTQVMIWTVGFLQNLTSIPICTH
jgi:hypothetical protein